jgi:hypothetical protein
MSRQDNFFLLVRVCSISWWDLCSFVDIKWALDFLLFLQYYVVFLFFEYCLYTGGIFLFSVVFVGGVLCVFLHLLHSSLVLFILGVLGPWEFFWRARSYFPSVWGSALWSVGPVLFIWVLAWGGWRGCTGFSSFGLCCGGYGTIEIVGGLWSVFLCLLQFAVCFLGGWLSMVGLHFS